MIYILNACVDWEGDRIITACSTIAGLVTKIEKLVKEGESFGEYCSIAVYNGIGTFIGKFNLYHGDIPGKSLDWKTKRNSRCYDYQEPIQENYGKLFGLIASESTKVKFEFAKKNSVV